MSPLMSVLAGSATLDVAGDIDVDGTANLDVLTLMALRTSPPPVSSMVS